MPNQKGFAPILIVILLTLGVGGYVIYQRQNSASNTTFVPQPSPQPSITASPSVTPTQTLTTKPISSIKPTSSPTPQKTATPSPTEPLNPTLKPSPLQGVYKIARHPSSGESTTSTSSQGHVISALLTDSNGDYIQDLSDFEFRWSIDNPEIADLLKDSTYNTDPSYCYSFSPYNIKTPCPSIRADLKGKTTGTATVRVKVTKKSEGKVVAEESFTLTVR